MADREPNYQPQSADPTKSCKDCKNFAPKEGDDAKGDCFGHEVSVEGTCDFFDSKEE
ncbi:MAG: hypothetical protein FJ044_05455 [Candidatus Cloacimonetes bacterium]|nr:hypothetical protein [Candidatus Cloacimonadota bacterium]